MKKTYLKYAVTGVTVLVLMIISFALGQANGARKERAIANAIRSGQIAQEEVADESNQMSHSMAQKAIDDYNATMYELYATDKVNNFEQWEGEHWYDKVAIRIAYWWSRFFSTICMFFPVLFAVNVFFGVGLMLLGFPLKFKKMRAYGLWGWIVGHNATLFLIILMGSLVNTYYLGI